MLPEEESWGGEQDCHGCEGALEVEAHDPWGWVSVRSDLVEDSSSWEGCGHEDWQHGKMTWQREEAKGAWGAVEVA